MQLGRLGMLWRVEEDNEEEEEELPLVRREWRSKARSEALSLAAPARMVKIQALLMPAVECRLEEAVPKALLCELPNISVIDVDVGHSDEVHPVGLLAGSEKNLLML